MKKKKQGHSRGFSAASAEGEMRLDAHESLTDYIDRINRAAFERVLNYGRMPYNNSATND